MKLFILSILFSSYVFSHAFTDAIYDENKKLILKLIENGNDVNSYDEEIEFPPLYDALMTGNLEIVLVILQNGANPNIFTVSNDGAMSEHILNHAQTIQEIVLLLSFGASPQIDNNWEYNKAIADARFLHLLIYYFQGIIDNIKPPESILELNKITLELPISVIQSYLVILTCGIPVYYLCTRDKRILKNVLN